MQDFAVFMNQILPTLLQCIRIFLYSFAAAVFLYRAKIKEGDIKFEISIALFFIFMDTGAVIELVTRNFFMDFYAGVTYWGYHTIHGEVLVYFFGFIGIGIFTFTSEKKIELFTRGLLSILPFILAGIILFTGMVIANLMYFLGIVIVIVPLIYFYIAFKATEEVRKRAFATALGYFMLLLAEANNYYLIQRVYPLNALAAFLEAQIGYSVSFLSPLLVICSFILLFYGYKVIFKGKNTAGAA